MHAAHLEELFVLQACEPLVRQPAAKEERPRFGKATQCVSTFICAPIFLVFSVQPNHVFAGDGVKLSTHKVVEQVNRARIVSQVQAQIDGLEKRVRVWLGCVCKTDAVDGHVANHLFLVQH